MTPTARELLARVKAATGPDRDLDLALATALVPDVLVLRQRDDDTGADPYTHWEYTGSIDDALALVERMLPGWARGLVGAGPTTVIAFVDPHDYANRIFGARYSAVAATAPSSPPFSLVPSGFDALSPTGSASKSARSLAELCGNEASNRGALRTPWVQRCSAGVPPANWKWMEKVT